MASLRGITYPQKEVYSRRRSDFLKANAKAAWREAGPNRSTAQEYSTCCATRHPDRGVAVSFPDIPEALTCGDSREDALEMAADALATAMEFYFEDRPPVPLPSAPGPGQELVDLPASLSAKVLLLNEMLAQKVSQAELARRLDTRPQEVQRIVNLDHTTKIDTIEAAFRALGRRMELRIT